jgi:methyl-accepting chemotaxis protein
MDKFKFIKKIIILKNSLKTKLIFIPLSIVFVSILSITIISSILLRNSLLRQMRIQGKEYVEQIASEINKRSLSMKITNEMIDEKMRIVGKFIIRHSNNLSNELLIELKEEYNVSELHWLNKKGEIIYSTENGYLGWKVTDDHPLNIMLNGEKEMIEEIRPDAKYGYYIKYAAFSAPNGEFVQVGIRAEKVQELTELFSYQSLVDELAKGDNVVYALFIDRNVQAIASSDKDDIGLILDDEGSLTGARDGKFFAGEFYDYTRDIIVYDILAPVFVKDEHVGAINVGLSMNNVNANIRRNILYLFGISFLFFISLGTILYLFSNQILMTLKRIKNNLELIENGDLSFEVGSDFEAKDELGMLECGFKKMYINLKKIIEEMDGNVEFIFETVENLQARNKELSDISSEQVAYLQETSAILDEINSIFEEHTEQTMFLGKAVSYTEEKASVISHITESLKNYINEIKDNSNEINYILEFLDEISFQTNILSLNAAIEASRLGGMHNKGFSVITDEIRSLASKSSESSKEIKDIIEKNNSNIKFGEEMIEAIILDLEFILDEIERININTQSIVVGSEEHSKGIEFINMAISKLHSISQKNAEISQDTNEISRNLRDRYVELLETMKAFKL